MKAAKVKAESGIELPPRQRGRPPVYPWETMKVGESFLARRPSVASGLDHYRKKYAPKQFVSRMIDGKCRIWRVK